MNENDALQKLINENPQLRQMLIDLGNANPDNDGMIFSKKLRARLKKFEKMNIQDALSSPEFIDALYSYAKSGDD